MALAHKVVALNSTTPTMLTNAPSDSDFYARKITISIQNLDSTHFVFVGSLNVSTASYGLRIDPGNIVALSDINPSEEVFAISDSGTPNVAVLQVID